MADNVTLLTGTSYVAQLYMAVGANQPESSLTTIGGDTFSRFRASTTSSPGAWSQANSKPLGVPFGTPVTLQVRIWDGNAFGSYNAAILGAGITGKSATFNYTPPDDQALTFNPADTYMYGLQSFNLGLINIPEPSSVALGIIGAVSLFLVRRRK
jgi:hypothetical protein